MHGFPDLKGSYPSGMNVHTLLRNAAGAAPAPSANTNQFGPAAAAASGGLKSLVDVPHGKKDGAKNQKLRQDKIASGRGDSAASAHLVPQRANSPSSGG